MRCMRLGLNEKVRPWTEEEIQTLRAAYENARFGEQIGLAALAQTLGRDKTNVSRKAREFGLTDLSRPVKAERKVRARKFATDEDRNRAARERISRYFAENGHPRGALGMKHSESTKAAISLAAQRMNARRSPEQKVAYTLKGLRTKVANGTYGLPRLGTSWKAGWREIGGVRKFYRSRWEANYARYLEWLKRIGQVVSWEHEPETFWFEGVKRGAVSYLPDFRVVEVDGSVAYHEVKGWMDDRSKTKIRRMAKYHPGITLIVVDEKAYRAIERYAKGFVDGWE